MARSLTPTTPRTVSVTSAMETNGAIRVMNAYDHRNRRIRKTVQRLHSTIAPPPSPPVGVHEWETQETHTFVWDGNNIVLEKVEFANGTTRKFEYFWGVDKSGSEQGAGGVEGLLAVSVDGVFYIPCYDHNGNIILYVSETGGIAAQYTYDPYGNIIESSGPLADVFSFGFSTQYHDRETGMVGYKRRFYRPDLGRWLNRDPIEEEGGENLYTLCGNNAIANYDKNGCAYFAYRPLDAPILRNLGITINFDWMDNSNVAILHEQLFFEDGGIPTNQGYFDDSTVRSDGAGISYKTPHSTGWNDCIMRKAVAAVRPRPYSLLGDKDKGLAKYNCQDWADEVRQAYYVIKSGGTYHPWGYTEMRAR